MMPKTAKSVLKELQKKLKWCLVTLKSDYFPCATTVHVDVFNDTLHSEEIVKTIFAVQKRHNRNLKKNRKILIAFYGKDGFTRINLF
jgi:hypothetical protein